MRRALFTLMACWLLSGCSIFKPIPAPQLGEMTDKGVVDYAKAILVSYAERSGKTQVAGVGGPIAVRGVGSATMSAGLLGAPGAIVGLLSGVGTFLLDSLELLNPSDRANAYNFGEAEISTGLALYGGCLNRANIPTTPSDKITSCGTALLKRINAATRTTKRLLSMSAPDEKDMQALKEEFK